MPRNPRQSVCAVILLFAAALVWADDPSDAAGALVPQAELLRFLVDTKTFTLIDARNAEEFDAAHVTGAINVPHDQLTDFDAQLPVDRTAPLVVYCRTGVRAGLLKAQLAERGYHNVRVLRGEQIFWSGGLAVFNCAATAALEADAPAFTKTKGTEK
jgi:phage shock protein E